MSLRNLYIILSCILSLNCFGAAHDVYPFATGNAGQVPEYNSDEATGIISLTNTYYVDPVEYTSDEDSSYDNGNAGEMPVQDENIQPVHPFFIDKSAQPANYALVDYQPEQPIQQEMDIDEEMDEDEDADTEDWWITPLPTKKQ
jgi:hypothetical protein